MSMTKFDNDANIQWKKNKKEKLTPSVSSLNHTILKPEEALQPPVEEDAPAKIRPQKNLLKIRKKIREVFDEEDDEDDEAEKDESLILLEMQQAQAIENTQSANKEALENHQIASNIAQIATIEKVFANKELRKIGKRKLGKIITNTNIGANIKQQVLEEGIKKKAKISKSIKKKDIVTALRGVDNFAINNPASEQLENSKTDNEAAKIILNKTGRKKSTIKKTKSKNSSVKITKQKELEI